MYSYSVISALAILSLGQILYYYQLITHFKATYTKSIFSFWSTPVYEKHAGGRHIRTSGQEIATLFTMDKWLDNYKVMTSMNMAMQQAVYKSTIVLINSIFQ